MRLLIVMLMFTLLAAPSLAQKGKRAAPTPKESPPVVTVMTNSQLPAEIVIREGDRIFSLHNSHLNGYVPGWTYYEDTPNGYGGVNFDSSLSMEQFTAVRVGNKVLITFSHSRPAEQWHLRPAIRVSGFVELDFTDGFFTIMTTGRGAVHFEVTDGARPSTTVNSSAVCVTTQFIPMRCAIGIPPGYVSHIPVH